ncbi:carboxypeptidase-like regulatory domain-containing protein [Galbibacter pacificus]|uniref:Carboxypeptidase-like regulatory domain-containing protein n=1 Tax=Galbibacter pacificus TaxID=2996052 RepID=A0ABT6FQX1_9FLAO|nr:carboxypeptidase-like regulatory domain-containing protein [Galbibacter pacificus]MDG3582025.1 carboxypeptidase-like regulatory domain-containing protein [Galbibacter pacificus]MDG3585501.1 carboxypeptidase-like regulatory domain-containing protein [Galbibacter pacificus]
MVSILLKRPVLWVQFFILMACFTTNAINTPLVLAQDTLKYKEYKGTVIDSKTNDKLVFATLAIENTNISSITNSEGEFVLKVHDSIRSNNVIVSFLGYQQKIVPLTNLKKEDNEIALSPVSIELPQIDLSAPKDALSLVLAMLKKNGDNYLTQPVKMTAFYRETIKKRRRDASLSEAVAYIYKQPNSSAKKDIIDLYKSRKSTNYSRLDTVALKLQGGPFTPLFVDIMKYPEYIFTKELITYYDFSFDASTNINDKPVYVVSFKQKENVIEPLFYGKLYIDAETKALASAVFNLNVEDKEKASDLLVRRKPNDIDVYPTEASYRVDYRIKSGKWYYGYGNVQLAFVVDRKGKLFNSKYYVSSEMAITDWHENGTGRDIKSKERLRPSIIIADEASGFSDPEFWGTYNVIEPEKSIESAISKIQRQLERDKG